MEDQTTNQYAKFTSSARSCVPSRRLRRYHVGPLDDSCSIIPRSGVELVTCLNCAGWVIKDGGGR